MKLSNLFNLALTICLAACATAMLVAQSIMAGEFRWFLVGVAVIVALSYALVLKTWKEFKLSLNK